MRFMMATVVAGLTLATSGCGATSSCLTDFPASDFGFEGDGWHYPCATEPCTVPTVAEIEAQCEAEGAPCAGEIEVTYEAARCIAEEHGLAEGEIGYQADLLYNVRFDLPIWSVINQTAAQQGETLVIDATSGEILEEGAWDVTY